MTSSLRFTSADLAAFPDDGKRYEIIDGELYVSKQPHWYHQLVCGRMWAALDSWNRQAALGTANLAPGVIFADDDDVAPDVIWISSERLETALGPDGKLHSAPELVIEVLSAGNTNRQRDREAKLKLYSRRGVSEYWIIDWRSRKIEVYQRQNLQLALAATLFEGDVLISPLFPYFSCRLTDIFQGIPAHSPTTE